MNMYLMVLWSLLLMPSQDELRQSYINDYKKITEAYKKPKVLSYKVAYRSFDHNSLTPDTTISAAFVQEGEYFYTKTEAGETYKNERYYVAVNHTLKVISVNLASAVNTKTLPFAQADTIIKILKPDIKYALINNGRTKQYTVETKEQGDFRKYKAILEFDSQTYLVSRFLIYLFDWENNPYLPKYTYIPFVEMLFSNYSTLPVKEDIFSTSKYFTELAPGDIRLTRAYFDYRLINSLQYNLKK